MYNILVVDDEHYSADAVSDLLVDYRSDDLAVTTAYLPKEAIAFAEQHKVDVLVVDFEMPGMNGLEVSHVITQRWPRCKTVVLTAYNESSYLHQAIRQGAVDYVLKGEGEEMILQAVRKAIELLEKEGGLELFEKQLSEHASKVKRLESEKLLNLLLETGSVNDTDQGFSLHFDKPMLLCVAQVSVPANSTVSVSVPDDLVTVIGEALRSVGSGLAAVRDGRFIVMLLQADERCKENLVAYEYMSEMLPDIQAQCSKQYGLDLAIASLKKELYVGDVAGVYGTVRQIVSENASFDTAALVEIGSMETEHMISALTRAELTELKAHIDAGRDDQFLEVFSVMLDRLSAESPDNMEQVAYSAAFILFHSFGSSRSRLLGDIDRFSNAIYALLRSKSNRDVMQNVSHILGLSPEADDTEDEVRRQEMLHAVTKFIDANLSGDLSLTRIADRVHFNASYLSRFFRKYSGMTISEYIWQKKLAVAKEQLADPSRRISEISESLGFVSRPYFTRFFKRMTGMSPKEYRIQHCHIFSEDE